MAGLPRYRRGGRGEGGAYAGSTAAARRTEARARGDWREAGGGAADAAAEPGTAPPSLRDRARRCEEDGASALSCKEEAVRGFNGPLNKSP